MSYSSRPCIKVSKRKVCSAVPSCDECAFTIGLSATRAIKDMVNASDFDRKMLLLATQMAHEMDLKRLLLSVLEALLQTLKDEASIETEVEAITVIRCLVRLVLKLLCEPGANRKVLIQTLIRHLRLARSCCEKAVARKAGAMISKDLSWMWRAAYNCGVQGCSEWDSPEDTVSDLFDISREVSCSCGVYRLTRFHVRIAPGNLLSCHSRRSRFRCISIHCQRFLCRYFRESVLNPPNNLAGGHESR